MAYTKINQNLLLLNPSRFQVYFTNLSFNNDKENINLLKQPKSIDIPAYVRDFDIDFTAIDFVHAEKLIFSTFLDGYDIDWNFYQTNRFRTFTNLNPGKYTFKIRVKNVNLDDVVEKQITLIKHPFFWQTTWFRLLILSLITISIYALIKRREKNIQKKESEKTILNKRMAELDEKLLRSQMNPHFIFNSLNSIQKYIWESNEEEASEYLSKFAKLMRAILENSRAEWVTLEKEVEVMKLYIELEHRRSNGKFSYQIVIDEHIAQNKIMIPPLILQPFIENAIWHGLNKLIGYPGNLRLTIVKSENQLKCIVQDDGVGRSFEHPKGIGENKSLGISITQQRIDRLITLSKQHAEITVEDAFSDRDTNKGTKVTIILPLMENLELKN
jgi:hypothetical protein